MNGFANPIFILHKILIKIGFYFFQKLFKIFILPNLILNFQSFFYQKSAVKGNPWSTVFLQKTSKMFHFASKNVPFLLSILNGGGSEATDDIQNAINKNEWANFNWPSFLVTFFSKKGYWGGVWGGEAPPLCCFCYFF